MAVSNSDTCQWLSVTEETLFLHDGLLRVTDLVELPQDIENVSGSENEVVSFDSKNPEELSSKLLAVCGTQNSAFNKLLEYRLNALKGLWKTQRQIAKEEQIEKESPASHEETINLLKKQGLLKDPEQASFSTRISLLLILPLLQSQSKADPDLCGVTAGVLLNCLKDCAPLSLAKEPSDCLKGLESLLSSWLGERSSDGRGFENTVQDKAQRENAASALVALSCARGHLQTFIHTVHLLQGLTDLQSLPVADVLHRLLETEGGQGQPSALLGSKHLISWGFEDQLSLASGPDPSVKETKDSTEKDKEKEGESGRKVATDGSFLYISSGSSPGVAKMGTGLHGTLRGFVYSKNLDILPCHVAYGNSLLLSRPISYDQESDVVNLCQVIDPDSLQLIKVLPKPPWLLEHGPCTTVSFCSDGTYFYWIWCPSVISDKAAKGISVFVHSFKIDAKSLEIKLHMDRMTLTRKEESGNLRTTETLMNRIRPLRGSSSAATLAALIGGETPAKKEENLSAGSTTCGVLLKTLVKVPVYCDGTSIVILVPLPGGGGAASTRSLFGSGGSISSLRSLATNLCFSLNDGLFTTRSDLIDAPSCSLARGTSVSSLGACFDVHNNLVWLCSSDYVDQFYNPGHQAPHHIHQQLGISQPLLPAPGADTGEWLDVREVVRALLQHVGSMCLHQLHSEVLQWPMGSYVLQQHPVDLVHMTRITTILRRAMEAHDFQSAVCCLVVLQLIFKVSFFRWERQGEEEQIKETRSLIWQLLTNKEFFTPDCEGGDGELPVLQREACHVVTVGLKSLYHTAQDKHTLLSHLLISAGENLALLELRNMILTSFAEQLRTQCLGTQETAHLRLTDDLVNFVLKLAVKDSCVLLSKAQAAGAKQEEFDALLCGIPRASPCLQYLMALRSHLLQAAILYEPCPADAVLTPSAASYHDSLEDLQAAVLNLSSKIISGASEVLESFLETCAGLVTQGREDSGLERLAKATVLGWLLPALLTALTHPQLHSLNLADALMPSLVRLILLSSQAALLLKRQQNSVPDDDLDLGTDHSMADLIGETLEKVEIREDEEEGFLTGLKIPAPWASGKTVETIHPLRDNYKFKEVVHIPGARCLYLRFDPRCSSQYDYDKLIIYAGPNTSSKKVAEYGGNTFGFGSRSVLGSGWPKDLVKVEGDTVTFSFEMRSGREHNTPDKAMWGMLCTVRAQECAEEVSGGLAFLADLALSLSVLACTLLALLYDGPPTSPEEEACQHLLRSKLLQRCVWQSERGVTFPPPEEMPLRPHSEDDTDEMLPPGSPVLPRIKLPAEIMTHLRRLSKRQMPRLRPSIRNVLQPETLEEHIISAVVKHLSLMDTVRHLSSGAQQQSEDYLLLSSVVDEVYRRFDVLLRQLQTMADLEQRWRNEVEEYCQGNTSVPSPFFHDYHLQDLKYKELAMLCFIKDVPLDSSSLEVTVKLLLEKFEADCQAWKDRTEEEEMKKTKYLVRGILSRLSLLLHVNITPAQMILPLSRTVSHMQGFQHEDLMVRSDTDVLRTTQGMGRSMSAPSGVDDDSLAEVVRLQRWRLTERRKTMSILQDLIEDESDDKPPYITLIDQLFSFIGSDPEKAVSCSSFLVAAEVRHKRGCIRKKALLHMKDLLAAASWVGGATHLIAAVASVLRHGPKAQELTCGGMVTQVQEAFAEVMTSVVQLAARYPVASCSSIGLLCTVPYTRAEERCLVRSGLVHLLDKLCSLAGHRVDGLGVETQTTRHRVSVLAWAGFQVLASRCVKWEVEDASQVEELEHSGLARQVSTLLTHHLARATNAIGNAAVGTEALQEVLGLLNNLSRSKMGKAILSQPACVSKLLSLLLDQRPSPKLVLIILQLCRVALPLMSTNDCAQVILPAWGQHLYTSHWSSAQPVSDPPARIISLLLAKLGDLLVPGDQVMLSSRTPSLEASTPAVASSPGGKDRTEDSDVQGGRISVFLHKREDQMSHDVIQPLLSSDNRPFRLAGGANMEKVVRMDRELSKYGKCEVTTEEAMAALKKAYKWAQMGMVVSTAPPVDTLSTDTGASTDKKKTASEVICKEKNAELARTDPVRAFISGHVANTMAAEVIALLHNLLTAPVSSTAQTWAEAVQRVLCNALSGLPVLLASTESLGSPRSHTVQLMSTAKLANAALAALGAFHETVKPGCAVKVLGEGIQNTEGIVQSVSEQLDQVTVELNKEDGDFPSARYAHSVKIPLARVQPVRNELFLQCHSQMSESVIAAVQATILPADEMAQSPLQQSLSTVVGTDGNTLVHQVCRVMAEIQTRAAMVLALYMRSVEFSKLFIAQCGACVHTLKILGKDCSPGSRQAVVEAHCQRLRMLYRDCAKPPPPPSRTDNRPSKEMVWDVTRAFPPIRACLFSQSLTVITFLGDPSAGSGLPRGAMVFANQPIPKEAPSFYWELEICSFGETHEDSSAVVSFGFAPQAEKKDGAWTNPVGTCLFLNNGKAVHYNGASLLQWRSVRVDVTLGVGDVAGIGWERTSEQTPNSTAVPKGQVYFTYRGQRLPATLDSVAGAMFPVVHIQKKNCRVKANFGTRPFAYAEGQQHREAAEAVNDVIRDIRESFGHLPFHCVSDSDSDGNDAGGGTSATESRDSRTPPRAPCKTAVAPAALKEYDSSQCLHYARLASYDSFVLTGVDPQVPTSMDDDSDDEQVVDDAAMEDHHALLVKAWEQKVFPVIRRRFRNETERKDGLDQIRGALQLGMTDIARQTVEFLYEENGGIPRDLHLPTIEDIREDLAKFTIERVKKGTTVIIRTPVSLTTMTGAALLPKFAVRAMLKTFGLAGTVLDVDAPNELVQVETYLRSEGVLVRFWYPLEVLEKPQQGLRKSSITGGQTMDTSSLHIHRELLQSEAVLARMFIRTAFLRLIDHCNSPALDGELLSSVAASASANAVSGMASCAATLQELDLENLLLLSTELLAPPLPDGTLIAQTPAVAPLSPKQCLAPMLCSLTGLVYYHGDRLQRELATAISRAAEQGEDYLIELTSQLCMCLQTAPEMFPSEEMPVTEVKINTDVHFPGVACLIVSCKTDPKIGKKDSSPYKSPWARIYMYTGKRIKKSGQVTRQEVVSYPRDITSTSTHSEQFSPAVLPAEQVHVRLGISPPPGLILTIHGLPPQFLLAVAYLETLLTEKFGCGMKSCGARRGGLDHTPQAGGDVPSFAEDEDLPPSLWSVDNIEITAPVLIQVIELLCGYLWRTDVPALLKEYMFHLLAQAVRILHYCQGHGMTSLVKLSPRFSPTHGIFQALVRELKVLYEEEVKDMPQASTVSGTGVGVGVMDAGKFSSYLQAVFEAGLAVADVMPCESPPLKPAAPPSAEEAAPTPALSPTVATKKKKLKTKRERGASSAGGVIRRTPSTSPRASESESLESATSSTCSPPPAMASVVSETVGSSSSTTSGSSGAGIVTSPLPSLSSSNDSIKLEDISWFQRAILISRVLRYLGFAEDHCGADFDSFVQDVALSIQPSTAYSRIIVISGIPPQISPEVVKSALCKVCSSNGGIEHNEVFVPEISQRPHKQKGSSRTQAMSGQAETGSAVQEGSTDSTLFPPTDHQEQETDLGMQMTEQSPVSQSCDQDQASNSQACTQGFAVFSLMTKTKVEAVRKGLFRSKALMESLQLGGGLEQVDAPPDHSLAFSTVSPALLTDAEANQALEQYFVYKLFGNTREFTDEASQALTEIFYSCFFIDQQNSSPDCRQETGYICLGREQILQAAPENLLLAFFQNSRPAKKPIGDHVTWVLRQYGMSKSLDKDPSPASDKGGKSKVKKVGSKVSKEKALLQQTKERALLQQLNEKGSATKDRKPKAKEQWDNAAKDEASVEMPVKEMKSQSGGKSESRFLTLDGFLQCAMDLVKQDARAVWRALFSAGFDIHLKRCAYLDISQAQSMMRLWNLEMDTALVSIINELCRGLRIASARLHPHELLLTDAHLASQGCASLHNQPPESIRLRFAVLQSLNNSLQSFFLPMVDLRPAVTFSRSTAALISKLRGILYYDSKCGFLNRILNATAKRKPDQAAPEITLDPLENIGVDRRGSESTIMCQAYRQLSTISSRQFCVRLASGGDPTYAFNVRMTGEEVHGTSGSFRQFLWQVAKEIQSSSLGLLLPAPSASSGSSKGKSLFKPGNMTFSEENLLIFLGQLLGITIRADIPLGLDLLTVAWRTLVGLAPDASSDLYEADPLTYSYMKRIEMVETESELQALCGDVFPRFVYASLDGRDVELVTGGQHVAVSLSNRHQYVDGIRRLRMRELTNSSRIMAVTVGMSTVLPRQLLCLFTPLDMELRTSGVPVVDLNFLKAHTMYQVGLMETDTHVEYFWAALESFSQEELSRFIKFACNQERIPQTCPCREGGHEATHVPPYPMKIAPPDGAGAPDARYIRVETCMFMIKLPQYSSFEIMSQRLRYAISCREDPLSG
ncbi:probable E3 ubiquitin-protein ligase HECTD4 isoform X2 [Pomacea canaliculata]|uniref:probable E3 ubiquitin-protein ligase HECTD4 isoform X2 n=1 Tax=Pomacea canaliculata TaxID=400727 RepID=UPI000D738DDF|nr:probable E3 ubiquitin-protein ligase HECTD4 isoform X2 [Pomacea canaliculata]